MTYRLLVTGSRTWNDEDAIRTELIDIYRSRGTDVTLVSGACPVGADWICEQIAKELGWEVELHPPDWQKHRRRARSVRNKEMIDLGVNMCLAFIRDSSLQGSVTAELATAAGIPVRRLDWIG